MKKTLTIEFDNDAELRSVTEALAGIGVESDDPVTPETTETQEVKSDTPDVDSDGMPWDEEIHSGNKATNADGTWKARKGKAQEAKDARAAFLATGGDVEAPDTTDAPLPTDDVQTREEAPSAPSAPTLPADAPAPVSLETVYAELTRVLGTENATQVNDLYQKHTGSTDPVQVGNVLNTNETARASLYAELQSL